MLHACGLSHLMNPDSKGTFGSAGVSSEPIPNDRGAAEQDRADVHTVDVHSGVVAERIATPIPMTIRTLTVKMTTARTASVSHERQANSTVSTRGR
jgi:hypothetical protein